MPGDRSPDDAPGSPTRRTLAAGPTGVLGTATTTVTTDVTAGTASEWRVGAGAILALGAVAGAVVLWRWLRADGE